MASLHTSSRRQFLGAAIAGSFWTSAACARQTHSGITVHEVRTISADSDRYHGWPTLIRQQNGTLSVVCSGGRESHVCPFGRVDMIRSFDNGNTWTFSRTILDGPLDDRDAGMVQTAAGTLLVTTFTSLAYEPALQRAIATASTDQPAFSPAKLNKWRAAHGRVAAGQHAALLGTWMIRSEDDGLSWSKATRVPVNSPHGPVNLRDGRLLYPGVALWTEDRRVLVCDSADDGRTWNVLSEIPTRPGDDHRQYHELHGVQAADGRLVVHIRNHNSANNRETLQTHSTDGGRTWSVPRSIDTWGLPSHLLRLRDGRLLMTYGHRRAPLGNQAKISSDHGLTWSEHMVVYADGHSTDLGYPSTVELDTGELLTVWYEKLKDSSNAVLRMARWSLPSPRQASANMLQTN